MWLSGNFENIMFDQRSTALLYISIAGLRSLLLICEFFYEPQPRFRFLHTKVSVSDSFIITLSSACLTFISPWTMRLRFMSPSLVTSLNKMWVGVFEVVPSRDGRWGSLLPGLTNTISASKCENTHSVFILVHPL